MIFEYSTLNLILTGTGILGITAGIIGCFALVREESLFGDTMAHAALPGIATMFLLTTSKNPVILLMGGIISSTLGAVMIRWIGTISRLKPETILATVLASFFGTGLVLLSIMQRTAPAHQALLGKFLFGNVALLLVHEVYSIVLICLLVLIICFAFWKELLLFTFDRQLAFGLGFSPKKLEYLTTLLMIIIIGIGLQTVGVVLITTLLIAPAAAARQWCSQFFTMTLLAGFFGLVASWMGTLISYYYETVPTGPAIVVVATGIAFGSMIIKSHLKMTHLFYIDKQ